MSINTDEYLSVFLTDEAIKTHMQDRYKANMELVETLRAMLMAYPDMRFGQVLCNFGFVSLEEIKDGMPNGPILAWTDEYHLEPMVLIERVKKEIERLG